MREKKKLRSNRQNTVYDEEEKIKHLRWKYNLIGILILALMIMLALDLGGCGQFLVRLLGR